MSTLIQQFATKNAIVQSIATANKETQTKSSLAMMEAAVICQNDPIKTISSYSYSNSSYGSFTEKYDGLVPLKANAIIENTTQNHVSYSYSGNSYGEFIAEEEFSGEENIVEGNNVAKKQPFFAKHKYAILALGAAIVGYFVFRKK